MNLHDIGTRRPAANAWIDQFFTDEAIGRSFWESDSVNITARDLLRAYDSLSVNRAPERPRRRQADALLADIYRFRDRMMMGGLRQPELDRLAFQVTREEYRALQEWIPEEAGWRGPTYERETGTMSVMGITVIPTR